MKISEELYNKIERDMQITKENPTRAFVYGSSWAKYFGKVRFSKYELSLLSECIVWLDYTKNYNVNSRLYAMNNIKVNYIGKYVGVWPTSSSTDTVRFSIDRIEPIRKTSYLDWFIIRENKKSEPKKGDGEIYVEQLLELGESNNEKIN